MAIASFGPTPTVNLDTNYDYVPSALEGAQAGQQLRGISALQGIDINSPESVNQGIGGLIKAGMFEQGSALMGLNLQRFKNQAFINTFQNNPFTQSSAAPAPGASAPDQSQGTQAGQQPQAQQQPGPDQMAQRVQVMRTAKAGIDAAINADDPTLRQAQIDATTSQLAQMGVPQDYVSHILGDSPDVPHLQSISDNIGQWLQHPDFGGASPAAGQAPIAPALHPNAQSFVQAPNPLLQPNVLNWLAQRGMLGVDDKNMIEALKAGQGYTGVVAPGQALAFGGNIQTPATYAPEKLAPGEGLVSPNTGQPIGQAMPFKPEPVTVPPGSNVYTFQPSAVGGPTAGFSNPNAGGAPQGQGQPQGTPAEGPRGVRNNNYGNIKALPHGLYPGQTGTDSSGYAMFDNPQDGEAAADKLLQSKQTLHNLNTVQGVIADPKYGWDPGNTGYASTVAAALGVKPTDPINLSDPAVRQRMLQSIYTVENGAPPGGQQQVAQGGQQQFGGKTLAPPHPIPGLPGQYQPSFTGEVGAPLPGTMVDPGQARQSILANEEVKGALGALGNWQAMKANAPTMTGPAAQGMLANIVRSFSGLGERQTNINSLMDTFGIPLRAQGEVQKALSGEGPLTPVMRQQLLDAAYNFVKSHYDLANGIVQGQTQFMVGKNGPTSAHDLDGILPPPPNRFYLTPPPAAQRVQGQIYESPKGAYRWEGDGWTKAQ